MSNPLSDLSSHLSAVAAKAAQSVVAVHGRARQPSAGIVWRDGLIVTAESALRRDEELRVTMPGGDRISATLKGRDPSTDLAVLACETAGAQPVQFSQVAPKPGELVLTVGRTVDTGPIVTLGAISGVSGEWQTWRGGKLDEFVRLDVSLYATSVGGAVVDSSGAVLGVVSGGLSRSSVLAITRLTIERVADALATRGRIARGYIGIGLQAVEIPASIKEGLKIAQDSGIMALSVEENGPAARAGILMGDVLISIGGKPLASADSLIVALDPSSVGRTLPVAVLRGGELRTLNVTVGERPPRSR